MAQWPEPLRRASDRQSHDLRHRIVYHGVMGAWLALSGRFLADPPDLAPAAGAGGGDLREALPLLAVLYVIFPLDFVPDLIPVLGQLDDLGVMVLGDGSIRPPLPVRTRSPSTGTRFPSAGGTRRCCGPRRPAGSSTPSSAVTTRCTGGTVARDRLTRSGDFRVLRGSVADLRGYSRSSAS